MALTKSLEERSPEHREKPDISIDTVGLICPYPALETKKALDGLEKGQLLEIVTNNEPTAKKSIPILCEQSGCTFEMLQEGDSWRILIRK